MMSSYYQNNREELREFIPAEFETVLEVGCGEGMFAGNYSGARECWGIEPNAEKAGKAGPRFSKLLLGTYDAVCRQIPDGFFDLIVCNDVIEHMPDHDAFFDSIKRKISPAGFIVGSIPNVRYYRNLYNLLIKGDWKYADQGILDRTHLRFFSENSLKRTLRENGFKLEMFKGINPSKMASWKKKLLFVLIGAIWRTSFRDIRYQQFGFRVGLPVSNKFRSPSGKK